MHPGLTLSESVTTMLDKRAENQGVSREDIEKENSQRVAIRRPIDPQELAWVVAFLASPKAHCITGEVIAAGGGAMGAVFQ